MPHKYLIYNIINGFHQCFISTYQVLNLNYCSPFVFFLPVCYGCFMYKSPFLNEIDNFMRVRQYSRRTIKSYILWIRAYIQFNNNKHPENLGSADVERFLTHLAVNRTVSMSTQAIALNAIAFLYTKFLQMPLSNINDFRRVKRPAKLPTVLTQNEVKLLFTHVEPKYKLMAGLLYGSGLRRIELHRLRVNDIDMELKQIRVWNGKGYKHRITTLAPELIPAISQQIHRVQGLLYEDMNNPEFSGVWLPDALSRKYKNANKTLGWQYLFPSIRCSREPRTGLLRRHHLDETVINKVLKKAAQSADITKQVTSHTLRHYFATHLLQNGVDIRTVQSQLGHADVKTTEIYTHILKQGADGVKSPLSRILDK